MRARCFDPNHSAFPYYGGRGVTVCEQWRDSFAAFLADLGPRPGPKHSLDRIDPEGNYEPANVRWLLKSLQNRNKRTNRILEIDGVKRCVAEWSEVSGVDGVRICRRIDELGWGVKDAVFIAAGQKPRKQLCVQGHVIDGLKRRENGTPKRYCKTCASHYRQKVKERLAQ